LDLREVPRNRRPTLTTADEVGGRDHGHRPHLQGIPAKRAALPGNRPGRAGRRLRWARNPPADPPRYRAKLATPNSRADLLPAPRPAAGHPSTRSTSSPASIPGSCTRSSRSWLLELASWLKRAPEQPRLPGLLREGQAQGFSDRQMATHRQRQRAEVNTTARPGHPAGLQAGGHLRGRVRGLHPLLLLHLRDRETRPGSDRRKVMILGGGPNRIGQGIEFDYCCATPPLPCGRWGRDHHGQQQPGDRLHRLRHQRPLYFEPLTNEDVLNIVDGGKALGRHRPVRRPDPLNLAAAWQDAGVPILGTRPKASTGPRTASSSRPCSTSWAWCSRPTACHFRRRGAGRGRAIGYPVMVRPSYVLGGRAMKIVYDRARTWPLHPPGRPGLPGPPRAHRQVPGRRRRVSTWTPSPTASDTIIGGIMEHIEEAGIHSGDSAPASCRPTPLPGPASWTRSAEATGPWPGAQRHRADERPVRHQGRQGLRPGGQPAGLRTVPFVSKATGVPWPSWPPRSCWARASRTGPDHGSDPPPTISVKEAVLPFDRFPGVDTLLGPEMKSTGEVMGIDSRLCRIISGRNCAAQCG
jgi:carbamoyl-phosphate synthase large subunit